MARAPNVCALCIVNVSITITMVIFMLVSPLSIVVFHNVTMMVFSAKY